MTYRINTVCAPCNGAGRKVYASGATWRGGMGAASYKWDICDKCWGSGDSDAPWTNIRKLEEEFEQRVKEEAVARLARASGVGLGVCKPAIVELAAELLRLSNSRKQRGRAFGAICASLRSVLLRGVGEKP